MNTEINLEDFHEDILGKAMRGLGIGKNEMAKRLGSQKSDIDGILSGQVNESLIRLMAGELNLDTEKLIRSAHREWNPAPLDIQGLKQLNLPFGDMLVNVYVIWEQASKNAWVFDTGPMTQPVLDFIQDEDLKVNAIFLTHTHRDHIACLDELKEKTGNPPVYVHELEALDGCELITEGFEDSSGTLSIQVLHTHGHSIGGTSYIIEGLDSPIASVGDAIFAGSMGGGMVSYENALRTNREKIMPLPDNTVLSPGHGPMTTVLDEKKHNPFFPEFT